MTKQYTVTLSQFLNVDILQFGLQKKTFLSNILAVRNCCDAYSFYFPASTSDLLMQTISLPLGSLLAVVLGHIILYENVGWQALAVRQNSAARCLSLQLFWKSAWIFFFFFFYVPYIKALWQLGLK